MNDTANRPTITISLPTNTEYWGNDVTPEEVPILVPRFRALIVTALEDAYPGYEIVVNCVENNTGTGVRVFPEDPFLEREVAEYMFNSFIDLWSE